MKTQMYLLRHAATAANLARPPRLQGRYEDAPLAPLGIRQAEMTRDLLAARPIDHCYTSPLQRAVNTAAILAEPHDLRPEPHEGLIECDVGRWEGLDWQTIQIEDPVAHDRYMANPAENGYPGGEGIAEVYARAAAILDTLLDRHQGETILVVSHHIVTGTYLAQLLGLGLGKARHVALENCSISTVIRECGETWVGTLNASFHLQGVAA
jgi:broad specificity phosphatase PhoE